MREETGQSNSKLSQCEQKTTRSNLLEPMRVAERPMKVETQSVKVRKYQCKLPNGQLK